MKQVVVLGRGGAGKSTVARRLAAATGLPVVELDEHFWRPGPTPLPALQWRALQQELTAADTWILDGDLGPFDELATRLRVADTIVLLDFPLWICAWRALRRSHESLLFWRWVIGYRRRGLPQVLAAIARDAPGAHLYLLRGPSDVDRFIAEVTDETHPDTTEPESSDGP